MGLHVKFVNTPRSNLFIDRSGVPHAHAERDPCVGHIRHTKHFLDWL